VHVSGDDDEPRPAGAGGLAAALSLGGVVHQGLAQSGQTVTVIAYGDTRFTHPANITATNPKAQEMFLIASPSCGR
jgi:hypothetical protein